MKTASMDTKILCSLESVLFCDCVVEDHPLQALTRLARQLQPLCLDSPPGNTISWFECDPVLHTTPLEVRMVPQKCRRCISAYPYILKKNDISLINVRICANTLNFDANGQYISTKLPIIHSANKIGTTLINNNFVAKDQNQVECVLIGDNIDDLKMSEGISFNNVIRIGFGDTKSAEFTQKFDYVLPIDAGFEEITGKLNESLSATKSFKT